MTSEVVAFDVMDMTCTRMTLPDVLSLYTTFIVKAVFICADLQHERHESSNSR